MERGSSKCEVVFKGTESDPLYNRRRDKKNNSWYGESTLEVILGFVVIVGDHIRKKAVNGTFTRRERFDTYRS